MDQAIGPSAAVAAIRTGLLVLQKETPIAATRSLNRVACRAYIATRQFKSRLVPAGSWTRAHSIVAPSFDPRLDFGYLSGPRH